MTFTMIDYKQIAIDHLKSREGQATYWLGETVQQTEKREPSPFSEEQIQAESDSYSWWRTDQIEVVRSEIVGSDSEDSNLTIVWAEANLTCSCYPSRDGSKKPERVVSETSFCVWIDVGGTVAKVEDENVDEYDYELENRIERLLES